MQALIAALLVVLTWRSLLKLTLLALAATLVAAVAWGAGASVLRALAVAFVVFLLVGFVRRGNRASS